MKKSFIIVLTILIVLCSVSCDLNQIGNTMQSMNKNLFFPAKVDEKVVTEKVREAKAAVISDDFKSVVDSVGSVDSSATLNGFATMGQKASKTIDSIIALGNESVAEQKAVVEEMKATPAFAPADTPANTKDDSSWQLQELRLKKAIVSIGVGDILNDLLDSQSYTGATLANVFADFLKEDASEYAGQIINGLTEPLGEEVATRLVNDLLVIINTIEKEVIGDLSDVTNNVVNYEEFTVSVNDVLVTGLFTNLYAMMTGKDGLDGFMNAIGDLNKTIKSFQLLLPDASDAIQDLYSSALALIPQED